MDVMEFLEIVKNTVLSILAKIDNGERKAAFQLYREEVGKINAFMMFLEENRIIGEKELQELLKFTVQALENEDAFLLEDVLKYAILDIIEQLEGATEE